MNSKAIPGKIHGEQNAKQHNPEQRRKGLGRISELSRLKLPARYTGVSTNRRQTWQGALSQEKGQLSRAGEFVRLQARDDAKLGRQPDVLGRMLQPGDPQCTHALSCALMSRLARCTLGFQRKNTQRLRPRSGGKGQLTPKALLQRPV